MQQKLHEVIDTTSENTDLDLSWLDEEDEATNTSTLSQQLRALYLQYFRPVYLIFDQFEELYILGDQAEQTRFIENVKEIQSVEQPVKIIFVVREEYLGHLFEFERAVPQLLRKKLRVEAMNLDKVSQVILGATSLAGSNIKLQAGAEDQIIAGIFRKIKGDEHTLAIQLPYLQVFLDKLYLHITGDEQRQADATFTTKALDQIGAIGDVLRDFLEEQAIRIQRTLNQVHSNLPEDAIWQILSPLATLEGTKEPLLEADLLQSLNHLPPAVIRAGLQELDKSRIIRFDENENRYELAHDSLAKQVAARRSDEDIALLEIQRLISSQMMLKAEARELFSEKQLNLIEPFLDKLGLDENSLRLIESSRKSVATQKGEAERKAALERDRLLERQALLEKNQKSQRRFIQLMAVALIGLIGLAFYAYQEAGRAAEQAKIATSNEQKAITNQRKAESLLAEVKKQQTLSIVNELVAFGDNYRDLGKCDYAEASYKTALDSLQQYQELPLYQSIKEKHEKPCN